MTVAIGLWCDDGLVLCTDSQFTVSGGLKYPASKIHNMSYGDWSVSLAFSGSPQLMELVQEKLYPKLLNPENDSKDEWGEVVCEELETILRDVCKKDRKHSIELLCATSARRGSKALLRSRNALVVDAGIGECIGVGDSSVLRFLSDLFVRPRMTIIEGVVLACYMVSKAITYIDGCGGPIQTTVLDDCGHYYELDMSKWGEPAKLENVEKAVGELFFDLSGNTKTNRLLDESLSKFRESVSTFDWSMTIDFDPKKFRPGKRNDKV